MQKLGLAAALAFMGATGAWAEVLGTSLGDLKVSPVVTGLNEPWALAFLPDGRFLVTERDGRLMLYPATGGQGQPVEGLPQVYAGGQGGLLDVMIPADFATSRAVWLSYAEPQGDGAGTAAGWGTLSQDGTRLENFTPVFQAPEGGQGGRHFGSRLVEGPDGIVYLTIGDRGTGPDGLQAQDPARPEGKVIALTRDAVSPPAIEGALRGVQTMGHRNPQGLAVDAQGQLWAVEHGAQGGDELNRIEPGKNYGWPVISYGENYGGGAIGEGTEKAGMEQPVKMWDPSIAPSGLMIYQGPMFPEWQGDFFTGSLNSDYLSRLDPDTAYAEERLTSDQTTRVRDVVEAPDGSIWFLSVIDGAVYRIAR
jgi:glucose/arabinose dehydrogenase